MQIFQLFLLSVFSAMLLTLAACSSSGSNPDSTLAADATSPPTDTKQSGGPDVAGAVDSSAADASAALSDLSSDQLSPATDMAPIADTLAGQPDGQTADATTPVSCPNGTVHQGTPANYAALLDQLKPCDTLQLAAGTYTQGLSLHNLHGTADKPITITGPHSGSPAIFTGRDCCNTVSLADSSYLVIKRLTLDGKNKDGDGVKAESNAQSVHHITLERLTIINHGKNQQIVGISSKCPAWNWTIRQNTIIGAGTGLYLGDSDGSAPFVAGVIEHNLIRDTIGYNLQIKHQTSRPNLPGMPQSAETIIRHNVFSKAQNASTGDDARPNLLVGHWPTSGAGSNDRYLIYGNFFYENTSEALFQGEGRIAFYNNVLVNHFGDAVNIQPHNGEVKTIDLFHNTVVAKDGGLRISANDTTFTRRIVGNVVFSGSGLSGGSQSDNLDEPLNSAASYLLNPNGGLGSLNLFPKSPIGGGALPADLLGLAEANLDFNGLVRSSTDRGAYLGGGSNPGWTLALEPKP